MTRRYSATLFDIILASSLLVAVLLQIAVAGPFEDAASAYARGDYATALKLMRPLADQGSARARFNLGTMYLMGKGVPQDYAEAVKWVRLAADQGYAPAQFALAGRYTDGLGVQKDLVEAAKWYLKAAEQAFAPAQHNLGVIYAEGIGVPQDYVLAYMWASLSAAQGDARGHSLRDLLSKKMNPTQIAEAEKRIRDWRRK